MYNFNDNLVYFDWVFSALDAIIRFKTNILWDAILKFLTQDSFTIEIWLSYQYTYLVPSYIEDLLCTYNHNYPKCSYNCSHHTDKHFFPCIHQHLNQIKRNYTKSYIFTKIDHIMKNAKFIMLQKQILPSHLLLPSPWNPTGQWQPFTLDSFIQKGKSVSLEPCPRFPYIFYDK